MKTVALCLYVVLSPFFAKAQKADTIIYQGCFLQKDLPTIDGDGVAFDSCPELKYNGADVNKYVKTHILYPQKAKKNGITGVVVTTMVIEWDGRVSQAKVVRSVDVDLDEEALRIVNSFPKWQPGKVNGSPVRVLVFVRVPFNLFTQ